MSDIAIKIENLKKQYHLGAIGGRTLNAELQSWWARKRGKEDPNLQIGKSAHAANETFWALKGINLEIKKGEAIGIIGANGAGKSTLLKILSRVTAPTEGDIWIDGRVSSMLEVGTGFHGELTGRENIYMNGAILGMTKKEVDQKMEDIIEFSECRQFIDTPVKRYSSGMYVKLAFAVAAHLDAEIMIMDEVLAVGDIKFQQKCLGKMGDASQSEGKTVLYVSHNMATVRGLCTRCIVLKEGQVTFDGAVDDAISRYLDNISIFRNEFDFSSIKRTAQENQKILLKSFRFKDRTKPFFTYGERLSAEVKIKSFIDTTNLSIRMTIFYEDNTPVSTCYTSGCIEVRKNIEITVAFCVDTSILAPGRYYADIILWEFNDSAAHIRYDAVKSEIKFVVEEEKEFNHGFEWGHSVWGHIVLPEIVIKSVY
ncbi:MAG: ATP-binding cassette domain-containing protein [Lachnospiraceae bacterium]|nr:ATP-binding cassette domain-containing protein [Lachnospiraceae bacterium]